MEPTPRERERQAREWIETYLPFLDEGLEEEFKHVMNNRTHSIWRGLLHTQIPVGVKRDILQELMLHYGYSGDDGYNYRTGTYEVGESIKKPGAEHAFDFLHARYQENSPKHYPYRAPQDRVGTAEEQLNANRLRRMAKEALGSLFEPLYKEAGLEWDSSKEDEVGLIVEHILMAAYFQQESFERGKTMEQFRKLT